MSTFSKETTMTRKSLFIASILFICALAQDRGFAQDKGFAQTTTKSNGFSYVLDIAGSAQLFTSCSDLGRTIKVTTKVPSSVVSFNIPGYQVELQPPKITLKRPIGSDLQLWVWFEAVQVGSLTAAKKTASIRMINTSTKQAIGHWRLENAWPASLSIDEEGNEVVILVADSV